MLNIDRPDGSVDPENPTAAVSMTVAELGSALGFRSVSDIPPDRSRDLLEIITLAAPWAGSGPQAFPRCRSQAIPSFGDRSAEVLVKEGRFEALKQHLKRIGQGGYA